MEVNFNLLSCVPGQFEENWFILVYAVQPYLSIFPFGPVV